jgi:soluble lytic murein transglycosylase
MLFEDDLMRVLAVCLALVLPASSAVAQSADAVAAVRAISQDGWDAAYGIVDPDDALTRDVITWMRLREGETSFADYLGFTSRRVDWPSMDRVFAKGEEILPAETLPATTIGWFAGRMPETGEGAVRLADALIATKDLNSAHAMLIDVWLTSNLTNSGHAAMIDGFADVLAPHHVARTDALLWRWRTTAAKRMISLLDEDEAALVQARLGYISKSGDISARVDAVTPALKDNAGLNYDRYNWLADRGDRTDAIVILKARSTSVAALGEPFRWSGWRRSLARWEMREGRAQSAYDLASKHFLTDGSAFADLEWVAGYVALTYLDDPTLALTHFQAANAAVASPISVGRMQYWIGRSYEVLDNQPAAVAAYRIAAQHQTGFYGLLAAEKLGLSLDAALTGAADPTDWQNAPFMSDDLTRAALTLLQAGERGHAVRFFAELGKQLPPDDLARLGAWLRSKDEAYYAVLLGKTAVARGVLVPSIYFPLHDLADMEQPVPPALSLSIARRESEFNAVVGSPVGALGLMQLMPATAKEVAGFIGEPYSRARLTSDWAYNARLGSKYLSMLEEDFGYSPVMMAAGYNAGPSRPKAWMDERGDPRVGEVNVVDWIEHIPFRETRNYVMRVTESIPVYEARLTSKVGPIRFTDLLIGVKPIVRPRPRPAALDTTPVAAPEPEAPASRSPAAPSAPAPVASIRPISRPGG